MDKNAIYSKVGAKWHATSNGDYSILINGDVAVTVYDDLLYISHFTYDTQTDIEVDIIDVANIQFADDFLKIKTSASVEMRIPCNQ